ncbi:MAG: YitT family protein [Clostridia bacterium]|nr:YitT family protein [Clostridia bacterium]
MEQMKRKIGGENLKRFAFLNFGILLMAVGIYFFKAPNGFATGGVSGLSIILSNVLPVMSQATYMLIINVLLLIIGIFVLGRECGGLTIYSSLAMSLENQLFEWIFPMSEPLTAYPLLELVYAVLLTGVGSAIIFKCKSSSGGTDIVALVLKKYTDMNVGTALLFTDFLIVLATFVGFENGVAYFAATTGLFSLLGLFAKVFVVDDIIDSINMCKSFTIITAKPREISEYIIAKLHHGATLLEGYGAFTSDDKSVILTVCRRSEAIRLRRAVNEIDSHAFIIITKTSEILGKGFRDNVN